MIPTHIVVIQSGWVFIGHREFGDDGRKLVLKDASCIRRWGTTAGLGELALRGKTSETVLDPCGTLEAPIAAVLFSIEVDQSKWQK